MNNSIPQEMFRNGRSADQTFNQDEGLYIRFNVISGGKVDVTCIRCPNQSVNRSKYSRPEWVLITNCMRFLNWGCGAFFVEEIPNLIRSSGSGGVDYHFRIFHDSIERNYSHSEIRAYKG